MCTYMYKLTITLELTKYSIYVYYILIYKYSIYKYLPTEYLKKIIVIIPMGFFNKYLQNTIFKLKIEYLEYYLE